MAKQSIDLGLSVMCAVAKYGQTMTMLEMADVCECSTATIGDISDRAIKKLKENKQCHQILEQL